MFKRIWEHLKMPRPLKLDRPMTVVSFTIAEDQKAKLAGKTNASEYIRDLIDRHSLAEERPVSLADTISKMAALRRERNKLLEIDVPDDSGFDISRLESEVEDARAFIRLVVKEGEVYHEVYEDEGEARAGTRSAHAGGYELYPLPLTEGELKLFGSEHDLGDGDEENEYTIRHGKSEFLELVQGLLSPNTGVVAQVEARLGEIAAEIERLEAHLSSMTSGQA